MNNDGYTRITLRIPDDLHARLTTAAARTSKSMNAEIIGRLEASFSSPEVDLIRYVKRAIAPRCHIDKFGAWLTGRWTLPLNHTTAKKIAALGMNGDVHFGFLKVDDLPGVTLSVMPDSVGKLQLTDDEAAEFLANLKSF